MMRFVLAALAALFVSPAQAAIESPLPDLTCETTAASGTGLSITLTGAAVGYVNFASQMVSGNQVYYNIVTGTGASRKVEVGLGTWTSPTTFLRAPAWSTDGSATALNLGGTSTVCAGISGAFFATGAGTGLNADLLDGLSSAAFQTALTNYVATVADGTGIDGTATGAGSTYTPTLDLSEITTNTWGSNNFTTMVFSTDGVDLTWDYTTTDAVATISGAGTSPGIAVDDQGELRLLEEDAGGSNYLALRAPAAVTTTQTCTLEDDASFIPDACVGDGTDAGGGAQTPWTSDIDADQFSLLDFDSIEWGTGTDTTMVRSSAGNVSIEGSVVNKAGTQNIWIPANSMIARVTSGADCSDYNDSGSNDVTTPICLFSNAADSNAQFFWRMPPSWNEGTVTFFPIWSANSGTAAQTIDWELSCVAISNDDPLNAVMGTPQASNDALIATGDLHMGPTSAAITCAGTPQSGDFVAFNVMRDVSDGTLAQFAALLGIVLIITTDAANDG